MDPITIALAAALGKGLVGVGKLLVEKGLLEEGLAKPLAEPVRQQVERWVNKPLDERALQQAFVAALDALDEPIGEDEDKVAAWLKKVGLDRLVAKQNDALRRQFARAVIGFTDPDADPPEDLLVTLAWPRSQRRQLAKLLIALRQQLASLEEWRPLIAYANEMAELGKLDAINEKLARFDNVFVQTDAGEALRVVLVEQGLTEAQAAEIERRYRAELISQLRMHSFRGLWQVKKSLRLPLAEIYTELSLLPVSSAEEHRRMRAIMLEQSERERFEEAFRRMRHRVTDALARSQRLVILGDPGAGKTMSLNFITLMLAYGAGASRLGLDKPYIPLKIRAADYALALKQKPYLALANFLYETIGSQSASSRPEKLQDFLRLALDQGACVVLVDGLDEVADDPVQGKTLRSQLVKKLDDFASVYCDERPNRLIVSSRIEGYWDEPLTHGFDHMQLSPLEPPDEVAAFLLRWFTAYEKSQDPALDDEEALKRVQPQVTEDMMPRIMKKPSTRRMATNPLLLTILALIYENVGKLPNRRVEVYQIATKTLIESWREAQTGMPSYLQDDLDTATLFVILSQLAYWLHETHPGGTAPLDDWEKRLITVLQEEHFEQQEAKEIAGRLLHHARQETGILAERGLGQYGFFHLTFEEYLAGYEIARQNVEKRRDMLKAHWHDPRWREVILLAAGQMGIIDNRKDDVSDLVEDLLSMEPEAEPLQGRQVVLAGRAVADIGFRKVHRSTFRALTRSLRQTMQDRDPDTDAINQPPQIPIRTRFDAGEVLDELGWLPDDLNAWVRIDPKKLPRQPREFRNVRPFYAMRYPITNVQFERFIAAGGYKDEINGWWSDEGLAWRMENHPDYRGEHPVTQPEYWNDITFGKERRGFPVVGVSYYEAEAFANWLTWLLAQVRAGEDVAAENKALVADLLDQKGCSLVRLPTRAEWVIMAGGLANKNRYPWDPPRGPATQTTEEVILRANTTESNINRTSPVAMYPQGRSQPFGLFDLAGNVWEWTDTPHERYPEGRLLCGGSWHLDPNRARVAYHLRRFRDFSSLFLGFRLVSPIEF